MSKLIISSALETCVFYESTDSMNIPNVKNIDGNMSLGLTMTRGPAPTGLTVCVCHIVKDIYQEV